MHSSDFQTVEVILVGAETVAKVASHGTNASITQMVFVILVTADSESRRLHERKA